MENAKLNRESHFLLDFLLMFILTRAGTFHEKMYLCFKVLGIFENCGAFDLKNHITLKSVKGFVTFLYEAYMIYMPYD